MPSLKTSNLLWLDVIPGPTSQGAGIEVSVWDPLNHTMLAILEGAYDVSFQTQVNDCGSGQFKLSTDDPKAANLTRGNVIKFATQGNYRQICIIETAEEHVLGPQEGGSRFIQVAGRGFLAWLARAQVYPKGWPTTRNVPYQVASNYSGSSRAAFFLGLLTDAGTRFTLPNWPFSIIQPGGVWNGSHDDRWLAWLDTIDGATQIHAGTDLLTVAKQMMATGAFSLKIDAATFNPTVLHAYLTLGFDLTSTVVLRQGKHFAERDGVLSLRDSNVVTRFIVEGAGGVLAEVSDPVFEAIAGVGRREGYLSFTTSGDTQALSDAGSAAIAALQAAAQPLQIPIYHGLQANGDYEPFVDFDLGDTVAIDIPGRYLQQPFKVAAITVTSLDGGDYSVVLDLGSVVYELLLDLASRAQLAGTLPGSVAALAKGHPVVYG